MDEKEETKSYFCVVFVVVLSIRNLFENLPNLLDCKEEEGEEREEWKRNNIMSFQINQESLNFLKKRG